MVGAGVGPGAVLSACAEKVTWEVAASMSFSPASRAAWSPGVFFSSGLPLEKSMVCPSCRVRSTTTVAADGTLAGIGRRRSMKYQQTSATAKRRMAKSDISCWERRMGAIFVRSG